jgi:DNA-binding response OmpR family regulator
MTASPEQRVLIADADAELRRQLYTRLLDADVYSDTVADGPAAIEKLAERRYAVCVLDLALPRVDGLQLLERIRSRPREEWPIVLILAGRGALPDLDVELVQIAIRKPVNTVQLADMIENCVRIVADRHIALLHRAKNKKDESADQSPAA